MNKIICLALVAALAAISASSSPPVLWARKYGVGWTYGYSVVQTDDGGFAVAGYTSIVGRQPQDSRYPRQAYIIRTDSNGDTLWTREYGGGANVETVAHSIQKTREGGFIIAGVKMSNRHDVFLIRTNPTGDTLWTRTYGTPTGGEVGHAVVQTSDGGFAVAGASTFLEPSAFNIYLVRTDSTGDTLWTRIYDSGTEWVKANALVQTDDGGFALTGYITDDAFLFRTDSSGNSLWMKRYNCDTRNSVGYSICMTEDKGFILAGYSNGYIGGNAILIRTDSNGDSLWTRRYGDGLARGYFVTITSDGGYVLTGDIGQYVYIVRTDPNGVALWTKYYGSLKFTDRGHCVKQTSDGGYIVSASGGLDTDTVTTGFKTVLIRLDKDGTIIKNKTQKQTHKEGYSLYCIQKDNTVLVRYHIPAAGNVTIEVFDMLGKRVKVIAKRYTARGEHTAKWNVRRVGDIPVGKGVYLIRLSVDDYSVSEKITLLQ